MSVSRRAVLGGLLSGVATAALAEAPLTSLRPVARPGAVTAEPEPIPRIPPRSRETIEELIANAQVSGDVSVVLADARTGEMLESIGAEVQMPPASVTKAVTALYALNALGGAHRFETRLFADAAPEDGILRGNLILAGGGDPTLSADHLAELASSLKASGIEKVDGRFLCWRGALPYEEEIEPSQLDHLGYNPAVSGLNLNYNRVHFEWKREGGAWQTSMDARTETRVPPVTMARVRVVDRSIPVFTAEGPDRWTVARQALGNGGSRWMPVRQPALYAGDVFRALARDEGIDLPQPEVVDDLSDGLVDLARHQSPTLRTICQEMLLYSTNLTAEVCGLAATRAKLGRQLSIVESAAEMNRWLGDTFGIECDFKDHSGLSDQNRVSAAAMVRILLQEGPDSDLRPILRRIVMRDAERNRLEDYPNVVRAKTGTLNFVSTLSGYVETFDGRDLVFAIFTADLERRARGKASGADVPEGAIAWNRRSKRLQQKLLQRWGLIGDVVLTQAEDLAPAPVGAGGVSLEMLQPGGSEGG